ncbi:MAG: SH3 domain-containing protein, partial [Clostridiales bacterium]|nr:SH3 domain-containing protein [Clostridiales bacterium]
MLLLVFALLGGCSKEGVSKEAGPIISEEVPNANENVKDNKEKIDKNDLKDNEQDLVNTVEETLEETIEEVGLNETIDINEQKEEETVEETESQTPTYTKVDDIRYVSSPVNVRKGPGVSYKKIGTLVRGQEVTRIGVADNGWGVIIYEGEEGYVSGRYLVESKPKDKVEDTTETEKVEQETKVIKETPKVQQPAKEDSKQAISDSKQVTETTSKEPESQETSEGNSSETESSPSNESNKEDIGPQEPDETNPIREPLLVEQIKGIGGSNQVITVTNQSASSVQVTIQAFEKIDGEWKEIYNLPGVIG